MAEQDRGFNTYGFSATRYCTNPADDSNRITDLTGTYETKEMTLLYETGVFFIAFYDSNDDIVTPTGGQIVVEASFLEGQWLSASTGGTVEATTTGATATYTVPTFISPIRKGRITFSGNFGAGISYCIAAFWRI